MNSGYSSEGVRELGSTQHVVIAPKAEQPSRLAPEASCAGR